MKKILLFLMGFISLGLINFSNAGSFTYTGSLDINGQSYIPFPLLNFIDNQDYSISCVVNNVSDTTYFVYVYRYISSNSSEQQLNEDNVYGECDLIGNNCYYTLNLSLSSNEIPIYGLFSTDGMYHRNSFSCTFSGNNIISPDLIGEEENNWSALYINDIQHVSAGIIDITIPEEIAWDYTGNDELFSLYVSGYNVDTQYIEDILTIQSYHPSSEDFTQSFTGTLSLILPYIIICLFVIFVWKLLKRIFK